MHHTHSGHDVLLARLRTLIAHRFRLSAGSLAADEPLIDGRLGLDSLDALELSLQVEEEFSITFSSAAEARAAFTCLNTLASFIRCHPPQQSVAA